MADLRNSLITGLRDKMIQVRLDSVDIKPFQYPTHFPLRRVNGFTWKVMTNAISNLNVAADIHPDNAVTLRKRRPALETYAGDIPTMRISREKNRTELKDMQVAMAMSQGTPSAADLVAYWGDDVDFCFKGINAECEFLAWKIVSGAGKFTLTTDNNGTFAGEFALDYDVDTELKKVNTVSWGVSSLNTHPGTPFEDLRVWIKSGKDHGLYPRFAFMNLNTFYNMATCDEVIKQCAGLAQNALGISTSPSLEEVNKVLARLPWLNGIQIILVDQVITREFTNKTSTTGNPFDDNVVVLTESSVLGSLQYDILADSNPMVLRAERGHTVVKKFGTIEPLSEVTLGEADAFPVFETAYRSVFCKTDASVWS